jgi:hypothetical protein
VDPGQRSFHRRGLSTIEAQALANMLAGAADHPEVVAARSTADRSAELHRKVALLEFRRGCPRAVQRRSIDVTFSNGTVARCARVRRPRVCRLGAASSTPSRSRYLLTHSSDGRSPPAHARTSHTLALPCRPPSRRGRQRLADTPRGSSWRLEWESAVPRSLSEQARLQEADNAATWQS